MNPADILPYLFSRIDAAKRTAADAIQNPMGLLAARNDEAAKMINDRYGSLMSPLSDPSDINTGMGLLGVTKAVGDGAGLLGKLGSVDKPAYGIEHRPPSPGYGSPGHDLTEMFGSDIYGPNAAQYYGTGEPQLDRQTVRVLQGLRNKPDAPVTIYRAVPKDATDAIGAGDWVTVNRAYAAAHGDGQLGGDYKIIQKSVPASDIWGSADSLHEFGYHPSKSSD